jgi:hypothetical protein
MSQQIWDSLCRAAGPIASLPPIRSVKRFEYGSLENEVNKVRHGIDSPTALTIHTGPEIMDSFWTITDEIVERIGGKTISGRWKRARQYNEYAKHFQSIFNLAKSFFYCKNENTICSLVGHSIAWNEVVSHKIQSNTITAYQPIEWKTEFINEGSLRGFQFESSRSPVSFRPRSFAWSCEFVGSDIRPDLFSWRRQVRISKLPTSKVTHQSDLIVFFKGDFASAPDGGPSRVAGPYHTQQIGKHHITSSSFAEDALFYDVIHLELSRFVFCKDCEELKLPSLFRNSIYIAIDPGDFGIVCMVFAEQPAFTNGASPFHSSIFARCLQIS